MTSPITTLVGSSKLRDDMDTLNTNFARRLAWNVETLYEQLGLTPEQGGTLFRLDSSVSLCDITLPANADLHVGWTVAFVLVDATTGGDVATDSGSILGLNGGLVGNKALTVLGEYLELVWSGSEWVAVRYFAPTP